MNSRSFSDISERTRHRMRRFGRLFDLQRRSRVFSQHGEMDAIGRIFVINLDRKPDRWKRIRRELDRFRDRHGKPLSLIVRRFSAIDARYLDEYPDESVLIPRFTLADQLTVNPNPVLKVDDATRSREITMTKQEVAVALSHIEVWRQVAEGDTSTALILEDDVFMSPGFVRGLAATWKWSTTDINTIDFDLLYLAYRDVNESKNLDAKRLIRRQEPGIWEASGYVLTRDGARSLLAQLPVRGPVDLWLNFQFDKLRVNLAKKPIIEQRIDEPSTNSYSVLPVLSQVGAITREKPLLPSSSRLRGPIIAFGPQGSDLTSLAKALSMVGYTCLSDIDEAPIDTISELYKSKRQYTFNAYINVGSLGPEELSRIAAKNTQALFITTSPSSSFPQLGPTRLLHLTRDIKDKWSALSEFLGIDYPSFPYPHLVDLGQQEVIKQIPQTSLRSIQNLQHDRSPWILRNQSKQWYGIRTQDYSLRYTGEIVTNWRDGDGRDDKVWMLRDDTFPSNLALFKPENFSEADQLATLTLRHDSTPVRDFSAGAIASRKSYLYGTFGAELKPAKVSGTITGLFLHRNNPRQEIDIEFLGRDTTKMLVNVYYNPGPIGTKLEYGYRGTPTEISLGFDASEDFHHYEIEWLPNLIRWKVDGTTVYERAYWAPTPIPDQPLEFNLNLWHSRSVEFAGRLATGQLPATTDIRSVAIATVDTMSTTPKPTGSVQEDARPVELALGSIE
jgi:GR25 family glycosyltransferase involved in LPS biosynthesis